MEPVAIHHHFGYARAGVVIRTHHGTVGAGELGKLVGMPVPGTCTFAGWEQLQDNSIRWGVPPTGVKAVGVGYLEGHQTEPDIKVMNEYSVVNKGRDQQLEAAIAALMKEIQAQPNPR